jgi:phage terminase small subunit
MTQKLTAKQAAFCAEYIKDFNASAAAARAGYGKATAKKAASAILSMPRIMEEVDRLVRERSQRTMIEADRVLDELARIAFFDLGELIRVNEEGEPELTLENASPETWRAISDATRTVVRRGRGANTVETVNVKLKVHDKLRALELLMKHLGMLRPEIDEVTPGQVVVYRIPDSGRDS